MTRAPCRRRTGQPLPRAEKFGDLVTADHKILNEGCESRDNHRYAVVVQDLATQWIQSCPFKTKTSHETEKNLLKLLEPSHRPKVVFTDNSVEFGRACVESPHFNTSSIRDKWNRWKSRSTSKGRHVTSIATIRIGWKVVVWLYGMLLLSAKRPKTPGRRENSVWKTIWRTIQKGQQYLLDQRLNIIRFHRVTKQEFINLARKCYLESFLARGRNLERRYSDSRPGRFGKVECIWYLYSNNQRESSIDQTKKMMNSYSHLQMVQQNCQEETTNSEYPL